MFSVPPNVTQCSRYLWPWHNITPVLRDTTTKTLPWGLLEKEILVDLWYEEGMFWWVQLTCYHWWPEWRFLQAWADELQPKNDRNTLNYATEQLALDSIGWTSTERRSCFPMSLTFWSSFHDRNKYGGIQRQSINFIKGCSLYYCDAICRRVFLFVCGMNHIPSCFSFCHVKTTMTSAIGKHDFRSVLLHRMSWNANRTEQYFDRPSDRVDNLKLLSQMLHFLPCRGRPRRRKKLVPDL